jgi:hypothetical protein
VLNYGTKAVCSLQYLLLRHEFVFIYTHEALENNDTVESPASLE